MPCVLPRLLIAVDHEGQGATFAMAFARLPPMAALGRLWDSDAGACSAARQVGYVLAAELQGAGIDYSFHASARP